MRKFLFKCCLWLSVVISLFGYAIFHYDLETPENTHGVTTHITGYLLYTGKHGSITASITTEEGEYYYYKVYYNNNKWHASRDEKESLRTIFRELIDSREAVTILVSDEKNYSYIMQYGKNAQQAVEISTDSGVLFPIDGHNMDQKFRRIGMIVVASLIFIIPVATFVWSEYYGMGIFVAVDKYKKKVKKRRKKEKNKKRHEEQK